MATAPLAHVGPWVEDDLLALPDDGVRYELLEGALVVSPPASGLHQLVSWELTSLLRASCPADLLVVEALGVRLPEGTVLVPDVLVGERTAVLAASSGIVDSAVVRLVVEIVSPGSRTMDRLTKPALYAGAGIRSLWRVEMDDGPVLHAYRLHCDTYVEVASAASGERLVVNEPFAVSFDPAALRP